MNHERLVKNPLLVLGLGSGATLLEVERAGQKLLSLLSIGASSAQFYPTPWGDQPRDEHLIRAAVAALKDPSARLRAELWLVEPGDPSAPEVLGDDPVDRTLPAALAFRAVGWRLPCT